MLTVQIDSKGVEAALAAIPGKAHRACATALTQTGKEIKLAVVGQMKQVFDRPTKYTLNSLQLDPATKDRLQAAVWFKTPDRMGQHYLEPQVVGGARKLKGFERAISGMELVPGAGVRLDKHGNMPIGQVRQILSVMGKAESSAGYAANLTARSARRNRKDRDYVYIPKKHGKLWPGVYQRVQTARGFGAKTKRSLAFGTYQRGRTRGKISSAIRARGLKPIMIVGRTGKQVKPRLDFYGVASRTFDKVFEQRFWDTLHKYLQS